MKNCIIGQSGGPTCAINATLCGVIKGALNHNIPHIYGALNGIQGIIDDKIIALEETFSDIYMQRLLTQTPAAFLGSCRLKLSSYKENKEIYERIFSVFEKYNIGYFFYIGGNDSMDTVARLSEYANENKKDVKIIGVPKTIDNDLPETDHTPGFGSAAKYIATTVREIAYDSAVYNLKSVTIIEIMGRNAGWLTCASALAREPGNPSPHLIYLPERVFDCDDFLEKVKQEVAIYNNIVVCVSEGIKDKSGKYVCESVASGLKDAFGHTYLSGTSKVLEKLVREKLGYKARGIELNVCQRCASHIASKTDIDESLMAGEAAVNLAFLGQTGVMAAILRTGINPYKSEIFSCDVNKCAGKEKVVPDEFISADGCDITKKAIDYLSPLIMGECEIIYENGVPKYLSKNNI